MLYNNYKNSVVAIYIVHTVDKHDVAYCKLKMKSKKL